MTLMVNAVWDFENPVVNFIAVEWAYNSKSLCAVHYVATAHDDWLFWARRGVELRDGGGGALFELLS